MKKHYSAAAAITLSLSLLSGCSMFKFEETSGEEVLIEIPKENTLDNSTLEDSVSDDSAVDELPLKKGYKWVGDETHGFLHIPEDMNETDNIYRETSKGVNYLNADTGFFVSVEGFSSVISHELLVDMTADAYKHLTNNRKIQQKKIEVGGLNATELTISNSSTQKHMYVYVIEGEYSTKCIEIFYNGDHKELHNQILESFKELPPKV